ncbi:MAG: hypothetical protein AAF658_13670, partial [Myxococcota bacterium]
MSVFLVEDDALAQDDSGLSGDAPSVAGSLYASEPWPGGTSQRGTLGINALEAAAPLPEGDWVLNLGASYSVADDFFEDGGENERTRQFFNVTWSPIEVLELTFSQRVVSNRNEAAAVR